MPTPTPKTQGVGTIVWGTTGVGGTPSGLIWESVSITPKNGEPIGEIENGDGAGVTLIVLADGFTVKATFIYDSSKTYPAEGAAASINLPVTNGVGGWAAYPCTVITTPPNLQRKKEATAEMTLVYRPGITPV